MQLFVLEEYSRVTATSKGVSNDELVATGAGDGHAKFFDDRAFVRVVVLRNDRCAWVLSFGRAFVHGVRVEQEPTSTFAAPELHIVLLVNKFVGVSACGERLCSIKGNVVR